MKVSAENDDDAFMINGSIAGLNDVTERFNRAAVRTVAAASGLSDDQRSAPDLPSALVDLSVNEKVLKATIAAVKVSSEMDSAVIDIVA